MSGNLIARFARWTILAGVVALMAACATPLDRCIAEAGTELGYLEEELAERRLNIARGYAIRRETTIDWEPVMCRNPDAMMFWGCMEPFERVREIRREINVDDERARIAQLERSIERERRRAAEAVAACRVRYPA